MTQANRYALERLTLKCAALLIFGALETLVGIEHAVISLFAIAGVVSMGLALAHGNSWRSRSLTYWDEGASLIFIALAASWVERI